MYSEKIMEEFYGVERYDVIKGASGVGKVTCDIGSEIIKIYIKVEDDKIVDAKFQTFGGVVAIAATSVATNLIFGKSLAEVKKFNANKITEVLGEIPENKSYILQLVVSAVFGAIDSFYNKSAKD